MRLQLAKAGRTLGSEGTAIGPGSPLAAEIGHLGTDNRRVRSAAHAGSEREFVIDLSAGSAAPATTTEQET